MGIKLPWFRARMTVKDEGKVQNTQLVGTYSYKFDSYFDSNPNSKVIALDIADEKQDKRNNSVLKGKKLSVNNNKNKSVEKTKSKSESKSIEKISEKQSSLEQKTSQTSNVPEKSITNVNQRAVKKPKKTDKHLDQQLTSPTKKGFNKQEKTQETNSSADNEFISKSTEEISPPEAGISNHLCDADSENHARNETVNETQKKSNTDKENTVNLKNNSSTTVSNEGNQKSLRERRIPDSDLGQLTIIIPDSSDEFDEEDFISPTFDDFHAYDEFDS